MYMRSARCSLKVPKSTALAWQMTNDWVAIDYSTCFRCVRVKTLGFLREMSYEYEILNQLWNCVSWLVWILQSQNNHPRFSCAISTHVGWILQESGRMTQVEKPGSVVITDLKDFHLDNSSSTTGKVVRSEANEQNRPEELEALTCCTFQKVCIVLHRSRRSPPEHWGTCQARSLSGSTQNQWRDHKFYAFLPFAEPWCFSVWPSPGLAYTEAMTCSSRCREDATAPGCCSLMRQRQSP